MRSQTKWGVFFILLGFALLAVSRTIPFAAIYSILLFVVGVALIIFRKREEVIEKIDEID